MYYIDGLDLLSDMKVINQNFCCRGYKHKKLSLIKVMIKMFMMFHPRNSHFQSFISVVDLIKNKKGRESGN